jgi:hypothetical protein
LMEPTTITWNFWGPIEMSFANRNNG